MNAYELADELSDFMTEDEYTDLDKTIFKTCNMLRKQADRIAHLEMLLANRNEIIDKLDLTTPQIKELSDEEIKAIANNLTCTPDKNWNVLFAKAILKKASEK
jgi:hypothetical protein